MSDFAFELTPADVSLNVWISTGASVLSLVLCATVLRLAYYVWAKPSTRPMINRISFRLLLWSVAFEILYDIAYLLVECDTAFGLSPVLCTTSLYFLIAAMTIVNYLCTAIAVNLMLTITFGVNPVKLGLEKWYVGISVLIGILVPLVPAALGHFRNDTIYGTCWIAADSFEQLMTRTILDLYLWQILSCAIATVSVTIVLLTLYRQGRELSKALFAGNELNQSIFGQPSPRVEDGAEEIMEKPGRWTALWRRRYRLRPKEMSLRSQLQDRFLTIAFQISLYPISLILVNGIITVGELVVIHEGGVSTRGLYALYCIYYFLYGGRGIAFAALAFFIDPCFRRALGEAWRNRHIRREAHIHPIETSPGHENTKQSFAEMLATVTPILPYGTSTGPSDIYDDSSFGSAEKLRPAKPTAQNSSTSLEMTSALTALAIVNPLPPSSPHKTLISTRSFVGVPTGHLPSEITDDMDVVAPPRRRSSVRPTPILLPFTFTPTSMTGLGVRIADEERLEPLVPDLPDEREEERLRRRAAVEHRKAEEEQEKAQEEETMRVFLATKAML